MNKECKCDKCGRKPWDNKLHWYDFGGHKIFGICTWCKWKMKLEGKNGW